MTIQTPTTSYSRKPGQPDLKDYWTEKYRPARVADCLIDDDLMHQFTEFVKSGSVPHMILYGPPGVSKTSLAEAVCRDIGAQVLPISGSLEARYIDTVRTSIMDFSYAASQDGVPKVIFIDEADYMNKESVQPALRTLMEKASHNVRFIMTCNYVNRIIEPIRSRCLNINMITHTRGRQVEVRAIRRVMDILKAEGVAYEPSLIVRYVHQNFPDIRKIITRLNSEAISGEITSRILLGSPDADVIVKFIQAKDFTSMRQWACENSTNEVFMFLEEVLSPKVVPESLAHLVLILAEYDFRSVQVINTEINLAACLFEIATKIRFKS